MDLVSGFCKSLDCDADFVTLLSIPVLLSFPRAESSVVVTFLTGNSIDGSALALLGFGSTKLDKNDEENWFEIVSRFNSLRIESDNGLLFVLSGVGRDIIPSA